MCKFLGHLKVNNLDRRFFHVQKGDCADASKYTLYLILRITHPQIPSKSCCHASRRSWARPQVGIDPEKVPRELQ